MEAFDYKKIDVSFLTPDATNAPEENSFYKKKVVFTGDLEGWDRPTAACLLQKLGADVNTSISGRTEIVVIGKGAGPSKLEKIIDLLADGASIRLMNEKIFNKEVNAYLSLINVSS